MGVEEWNPALFPPVQEDLVVQFGQFFLVNDFKAGEADSLAFGNADFSLTVNEQISFGQGLAELDRVLGSGMVGFTKFQGIVGELRRLAVIVKKLLFPAFFDEIIIHIHAQGQLVAAGHFRENERVTADIGRDIGVWLPFLFIVQEQVFIVPQAQNGHGRGIAVRGEGNRVEMADLRHFDQIDRNGVHAFGEAEAEILLQGQIGMSLGVQRRRFCVKQG